MRKIKVGKVYKMKNNHTGQPVKMKVRSIKRTEKTEDLVDLHTKLNKKGYSFYFKSIRIWDEFRLDDRGVVHSDYIVGQMLKLYNDDYNITIYDTGKGFELSKLEVFNQNKGLGSKFLKDFNDISIELDYEIFVKPGVPGGKSDYDVDNKQRINFYTKNGFSIIKEHFNSPLLSNKKIIDVYYE